VCVSVLKWQLWLASCNDLSARARTRYNHSDCSCIVWRCERVFVCVEFFMCVENVSRSGKPYRTNDAGKLRRGKKSSAASAHTHTWDTCKTKRKKNLGTKKRNRVGIVATTSGRCNMRASARRLSEWIRGKQSESEGLGQSEREGVRERGEYWIKVGRGERGRQRKMETSYEFRTQWKGYITSTRHQPTLTRTPHRPPSTFYYIYIFFSPLYTYCIFPFFRGRVLSVLFSRFLFILFLFFYPIFILFLFYFILFFLSGVYFFPFSGCASH